MNDVNKIIRYNSLLLIYQELLSKTQKEILTDYFAFNLSISEIAENRNVSRAAVEDAIKKGQVKLEEFESKLQINKKNEEILSILDNVKNLEDKKEINLLLEQIERIVK